METGKTTPFSFKDWWLQVTKGTTYLLVCPDRTVYSDLRPPRLLKRISYHWDMISSQVDLLYLSVISCWSRKRNRGLACSAHLNKRLTANFSVQILFVAPGIGDTYSLIAWDWNPLSKSFFCHHLTWPIINVYNIVTYLGSISIVNK